jgi:hypothetical protein
MKQPDSRSTPWTWIACAAALVAGAAHASPGPLQVPNSSVSTSPYAIAPIQGDPARNPYQYSGVVVDVHGRTLTPVRGYDPEPMNAGSFVRPGIAAAPEVKPDPSGVAGPPETPNAQGPGAPAPMPSPGVVPQVPEPSTYALMGAGLAALAWVARRRRR